jgi:hypothetical protein
MRKTMWRGMLAALCCSAMFFYVASRYVDRHPDSAFAYGWYGLGNIARAWMSRPVAGASEGLELREQEAVCAPDEPHPVDALLPDPAKLTADWQPFETIDILRDANKRPCDPVPPCCETRERLLVMPRPDTTAEPEIDQHTDQEQEQGQAESRVDPKAVQERLRRALQSFLQQADWPAGAGIDTMEFRPSDAKRGEFDRIPF